MVVSKFLKTILLAKIFYGNIKILELRSKRVRGKTGLNLFSKIKKRGTFIWEPRVGKVLSYFLEKY